MMQLNGFVFDIEANDLYPGVTKIWYIRLTSIDQSKTLRVNPFNDPTARAQILDFLNSFEDNCLVIGHNILQYDNWAIWKVLDISFKVGKNGSDWLDNKKVQFVDTRYLSMFIDPDQPGHSLESCGERVGELKIDYRQALIDAGAMQGTEPEGFEFSFWHPLMETYCDQDVNVNLKVFKYLWNKAVDLYKEAWLPDSYKVSQKGFYLMGAQEFTGYKFDIEQAKELEPKIQAMIEEIAAEVEPKLPLRPLKKGEQKEFTMPAKPFKKDGSLSSHMIKWIEKHKATYLGDNKVNIFERVEEIEGGKLLEVQVPMELKDQDALKNYFLSLGWEPVFYNVKKNAAGKAERDSKGKLILTTPKLQEQGKLDPGLLDLAGDIPQKCVRFLSLRNRLGVLQGWLSHPRLQYDGRLPARSSKITNTHRQAHSVVCNVPKAEDGVLLGKEFRSLFCSEEGFSLAAADAVAGENFTEAHYTKPYPGGEEYVNDLLSGDPHLKNCVVFYPQQMKPFDISLPGIKDDAKIKPLRTKSKSGKYALTFGCSPGKLAKTLGLPEHQGKALYDNFWDANIALKALKEQVEKYWETTGQKKYLPGLDARLLCTRSKHSLLNILFQSALAIIMDYALAIMDKKLGDLYLDEYFRPYYLYKGFVVRRVCYYHDEAAFECETSVANEISEMLASAIASAANYLKLKVPLKGEGKVGKNWKETH